MKEKDAKIKSLVSNWKTWGVLAVIILLILVPTLKIHHPEEQHIYSGGRYYAGDYIVGQFMFLGLTHDPDNATYIMFLEEVHSGSYGIVSHEETYMVKRYEKYSENCTIDLGYYSLEGVVLRFSGVIPYIEISRIVFYRSAYDEPLMSGS